MGNKLFAVSPQLRRTDSFLYPYSKTFHKRGANGSGGSANGIKVEDPIDEVPNDVLYLILSFLTPDYIVSTVSKVSREFLYLSYSEVLWKILSTNTLLLFHKKLLENSSTIKKSSTSSSSSSPSYIKSYKQIHERKDFILYFAKTLLQDDKSTITKLLELDSNCSWRTIYKYILIYFTCFVEDVSREQATAMKLETLKVIIVGNSNIGKSKFVMRFQDQDFNATPSLLPINQNRIPKVCSYYNNKYGKSLIQLEIFDDLGYNVHFFENVDCILLCFDMDEEESFTDIQHYWMKQLFEVEKIDKADCVLVGIKRLATPQQDESHSSQQNTTITSTNTTTTSSQQTLSRSYHRQQMLQQQFSNFYKQTLPKKVNRNQVKQFAKLYRMPFFEVEAKQNYNVELPFFSLVIQTMHKKFLKQYCM